MTVVLDTIPASIRKPGVYMEFNLALAVRNLPTNRQSICLIVPLEAEATALPNVPTQVFSAPEALAKFGAVAQEMVSAAITAYRYAAVSCVGVTISGDTEPDISAALAATALGGYTILVPAWFSQTALTALRTHINTYTDSIEQQSIVGVAAVTSTMSAAAALATALNSGAITIALLPGTTSTARQVAAAYAAMIASEEDPARPLNTLALTGIAVPPIAVRLGRTEQEACLNNGVTPLEVGPGDLVQIVRAITTYTKSAAGATDVSLLDLTTIRTLYYVRQACRERIRLRFPRSKLSKKTPGAVRSELLDVLQKLEALEIVEEVEANAPSLVVERSEQDVNRLNAAIPTDVVNGLHVFAGRIDLLL
ncbi:phage tail sheath subtilisin-like domain-containing protein [Pseudomonas corrugata]|uniref:Phage tail sheath subtilisin-like domain-containing protein n=1 Tax=Pseudomonas corrugata TaxID=47879 RepID=A0A8B6UUN0_9PSED|nr:phage tail sheath C-terminal domain-containing protein [Pseudomonas corrugata]MDU9022169.1 phage tail sheath C-terminal domain-containing protein [Pseudomonas corrugata]QTH15607.1 phage tail sheath subtilisin-like domain-containing protein [Pseudomonas corrugata]UZD92752.1 phage tail sheath subtilisin-like domain-containing protein [Pseudomonas corrugata]UZD96762.1 phage tail sheath subtilisin-like domain-containing protein [Pseudomonas corrugata]